MSRPEDQQSSTPAGHASAAEANREFYAGRADGYDASTSCLVRPEERERLRAHLALAVSLNPGASRALDAGGGTGNAAELLLGLGIDPVVVDVSHEMATRWERKQARLGGSAPVVVGEIEDYLAARAGAWDLIVFSSVLHHLEDPGRVLGLAARGLAPGGVLVSIFDPTVATPVLRRLRRLDWIAYAARRDPALLRAAAQRRLTRTREPQDEDHIGRLAERHALTGLDDSALAGVLTNEGLEIVRHERVRGARTKFVRWALRAVGAATEFSFIARRPPSGRR